MITLLLTVVIYVEYIESSIPVFDTVSGTPYLLQMFLVSILLLTFELLVSTLTSFLYHISYYELINFSRSEALVSIWLARCFSILTCYTWRIEVPSPVRAIAEDKSDQMSRLMVGKPPVKTRRLVSKFRSSKFCLPTFFTIFNSFQTE